MKTTILLALLSVGACGAAPRREESEASVDARAQAEYERGMALLGAKHAAEAVPPLERAVALDDTRALFLVGLAEAYAATERPEDAYGALSRVEGALSMDPRDASQSRARARRLRDALALKPRKAPARAKAALEPEPLTPEEERAYALPLNAELYGLVDALHERRDEAGSLESEQVRLAAELRTSPLDVGLLWRYGRCLIGLADQARSRGRRMDLVHKALAMLDDARQYEPLSADVLYWQTQALLRLGRYNEARGAVEAGLVAAPGEARMHDAAGRVYWALPDLRGGDRERSLAEFQKAQELANGSSAALDASDLPPRREELERLRRRLGR